MLMLHETNIGRVGDWFPFALESDDEEATQGGDATQTQLPRGAATLPNPTH